MNHEPLFASEAEAQEHLVYRDMSKLAVTALGLGIFSGLAFLAASLLVIPAVGVAVSLAALVQVRRRSQELTGEALAKAGLAVSLGCFLLAGGLHAYIFATEVPENYSRVYFSSLQPIDSRTEEVPPRAEELDGEKIFIKGYVHPSYTGGQRFVLVPDMKTCCFGGTPKPTDMIEVILAPGLRIDYSLRRRSLGGVFHVNAQQRQVGELAGVPYRLEADYLK